MNVLVVIQARLGSTRLPGKVLLPLGGKPVLQWVVERAQRSGYPVAVCIPCESGPLLDPTNPLQPWINGHNPCGVWGWQSSGPPEDVLFRFSGASHYRQGGWDIIVRLTADCPFLDPALIRRAVEAIEAGHDYAGNTVERHWPRGLDVEAFTADLLRQAHTNATDPYDREHVTPWMQRWASHPHSIEYIEKDGPRLDPAWRWVLDTPADYAWLQEAVKRFPDPTPEQLLTLTPRYD